MRNMFGILTRKTCCFFIRCLSYVPSALLNFFFCWLGSSFFLKNASKFFCFGSSRPLRFAGVAFFFSVALLVVNVGVRIGAFTVGCGTTVSSSGVGVLSSCACDGLERSSSSCAGGEGGGSCSFSFLSSAGGDGFAAQKERSVACGLGRFLRFDESGGGDETVGIAGRFFKDSQIGQ